MFCLGVIPARGGSKTVPRKNISLLNGKPMIAYTIEAAHKSKKLSHFVVSSEDEEIINIAKDYGAPVPFVRPSELATDEAPTLPVVQHAVEQMEIIEDVIFDFIVLLQPTTPLRQPEDIDEALDKLIATGADSVISVCDVGAYHPARMRWIVDDQLIELPIREPKEMLRRQDLTPVYIRNGAVYAVKRDVVMKQNSMIGKISRPYIMQEIQSINVDSKLDYLLAEIILSGANSIPLK